MEHYWRYTKHLQLRLGWFGRVVVYMQERHTGTGVKRWRRAKWKDKRNLESHHLQLLVPKPLDKRTGRR